MSSPESIRVRVDQQATDAEVAAISATIEIIYQQQQTSTESDADVSRGEVQNWRTTGRLEAVSSGEVTDTALRAGCDDWTRLERIER
jgi:hypothetical protein